MCNITGYYSYTVNEICDDVLYYWYYTVIEVGDEGSRDSMLLLCRPGTILSMKWLLFTCRFPLTPLGTILPMKWLLFTC